MAIKRELKEELGVEVNLLTKLGLVRDYYHLINRKIIIIIICAKLNDLVNVN